MDKVKAKEPWFDPCEMGNGRLLKAAAACASRGARRRGRSEYLVTDDEARHVPRSLSHGMM